MNGDNPADDRFRFKNRQRFYVYAYYDAAGTPLYVGQSYDLPDAERQTPSRNRLVPVRGDLSGPGKSRDPGGCPTGRAQGDPQIDSAAQHPPQPDGGGGVTNEEFEWMTTAEVAQKIRKSKDYVQRQCAAGNIRAKKLGTDWRISVASLERFMAGDPAPSTRPLRRRAS